MLVIDVSLNDYCNDFLEILPNPVFMEKWNETIYHLISKIICTRQMSDFLFIRIKSPNKPHSLITSFAIRLNNH